MTEFKAGIAARWLGVAALTVALAGCSGNTGSTIPAATTPTAAAFLGSYVFSVSGTDPSDGDYSALGSFTADGKGNITSAVADYNLGSGIDNDVPLTGTYTVSGGTATVMLTDGASVKDTFTASIVGTGTTPIQGFDGTGTGTLYRQVTSGFTPAGMYSFSITGEGDGSVTGSGNFVANSAGTFTGGMLTYNDTSTSNSYSPVTGFLATPETDGRGLAALEGNNLAYYVVAPNQIMMLGLDDRALLNLPVTKQ